MDTPKTQGCTHWEVMDTSEWQGLSLPLRYTDRDGEILRKEEKDGEGEEGQREADRDGGRDLLTCPAGQAGRRKGE